MAPWVSGAKSGEWDTHPALGCIWRQSVDPRLGLCLVHPKGHLVGRQPVALDLDLVGVFSQMLLFLLVRLLVRAHRDVDQVLEQISEGLFLVVAQMGCIQVVGQRVRTRGSLAGADSFESLHVSHGHAEFLGVDEAVAGLLIRRQGRSGGCCRGGSGVSGKDWARADNPHPAQRLLAGT